MGVHLPSTVAHHWPPRQSAVVRRQSEMSQHEMTGAGHLQPFEPGAAVLGPGDRGERSGDEAGEEDGGDVAAR